MSPMTGKVCVVTGASSGIGRRTALDLAAEGAQVCVAARREERLQELVDEMGGESGGHSYVVTDVAQRADVQKLAAHVEERYGRCDVLINNAGIPGTRQKFTGPEALENLENVMAVNFYGAAYCTAELLPLLKASAPSHVVNVASMAGRIAPPGLEAYSASKFALVGWSESLQGTIAKHGVYVSLIEPGFIPTEGFPQKNMVSDPFMKYLLGTEADVSAAIRDAIENRKPQRVVPRWYYVLQFPKVLSPRLFRSVRDRIMKSDVGKRASDFV